MKDTKEKLKILSRSCKTHSSNRYINFTKYHSYRIRSRSKKSV